MGKKNNKGFTLVEILLSIVLLAILILPSLYGFFSAAKINKKANEIQQATALAQNLLETVKNMTLENTAIQFYGKDSLSILPDNYSFDTYEAEGYGEYILNSGVLSRVTAADTLASVDITSIGPTPVYSFSPPADRKTYYFGIKNIRIGGIGYDVILKMDATNYSDTAKYSNSMNNYRMPKLLDLDQDAVAVIDLEGMTTTWSDNTASAYMIKGNSTDDQAIKDFTNLNLAYLAYLKSLPVPKGTTVTIPDPIPESTIISNIKKEITINLVKDAAHNKIQIKCTLLYTCNMDLNGDGAAESLPPIEIVSGNFPIPALETVESSVYLFYTPSVFTDRDSINIRNNSVNANVYIVNQDTTSTSRVMLHKFDTLGTTRILTNLTDAQRSGDSVAENQIYDKEITKNRIYDVSVSVYPSGTIDSGNLTNELVNLSTVGEE